MVEINGHFQLIIIHNFLYLVLIEKISEKLYKNGDLLKNICVLMVSYLCNDHVYKKYKV